ncbi:hypothetical protein BM221_001626 [Beauveria bassiana]|uniref:Uncharacterized protein n=1 Tax=Beauveria bassiana TaxID=176275 RepID=A0A2N6NW85_BEABA|nr:hypothetical protein BM221_001626 [Beauveria bassiana]
MSARRQMKIVHMLQITVDADTTGRLELRCGLQAPKRRNFQQLAVSDAGTPSLATSCYHNKPAPQRASWTSWHTESFVTASHSHY